MRLKFIGLAALAGVAAVLSTMLFLEVGRPAANRTPIMTMPANFNAADYRAISALVDSGQIQVQDLSADGEYFESYLLPNDKGAHLRILHDDSEEYRFVNVDGVSFGSIRGGPSLYPMGDTFVSFDGYFEVWDDAVSSRQPYQIIGNSPDLTELQAMVGQATHYRSFSWADLPADSPERDARLRVHVMRIDGVWKKVVTDYDDYIDWKYPPFHDLMSQNVLGTDRTAGYNNGSFKLERIYFDGRTFFPAKGPSLGSTTGTGRPKHWTGTGYYKLHVGDEALQFYVENDILNLSGSGYIYLWTEGRDDLNFVLLHHSGKRKISFLLRSE